MPPEKKPNQYILLRIFENKLITFHSIALNKIKSDTKEFILTIAFLQGKK